ncbi:MAG: ATP-binding protein [Conexivisphaerales archaeon]
MSSLASAEPWYFDDMQGKFQARLKGVRTETKSAMDGNFEGTSIVATLEAKFDMEVFDRLHDPTFIAIERETSKGPINLVYEVTSVQPMHFQMLGVTSSVPQQIREEFLERVSKSWNGSQETWIDLAAFHTGYKMFFEGNELKFERTKLTPLQGSVAHLLSKRAVESLICVENGMELGRVKGLDIELAVDESSLVKYHMGVFGFTGTGKSNLTSLLVRKLMERDSRLKVCFLDVSGEYSVNLIDKLDYCSIYSAEEFDGVDGFAQSQVIPDTLASLPKIEERIRSRFETMNREGRLKRLAVSEQFSQVSLDSIYEVLERISSEGKTGSLSVENTLRSLQHYFMKKGIPSSRLLSEVDEENKNHLKTELESLKGKLHEKSGALKDVEALLEMINNIPEGESPDIDTPETLAHKFLSGEQRMLIMYLPEPYLAQQVAARFLNRLLYLKKIRGRRENVLVVLDEAQEFAAKEPKGTQTDSNRAVEALLRQGRKYGASALISTQRVAYINVNALQQLHSYFVSTLPRVYDRMVIADSFSLDLGVLQKTTELQTGEWLFVSYKATKQKNVPVFLTAQNNEDIVRSYLSG